MHEISSPAKVNLVLCVGPEREDGYHEIVSAMQTIDLCDTIEFELNMLSDAGVEIEMSGIEVEDTLIRRTVDLWTEVTGTPITGTIKVDKKIPVGAGLGGGSSNAATVLRYLNSRASDNAFSFERLCEIGAQIGSDVPFFLNPTGAAIVQGRGEVITPCAPLIQSNLLIVWPGVGCNTGDVYRRSMPRETLPSAEAVQEQARAGVFSNDLAAPAIEVEPRVAETRDLVFEAYGEAFVSGSGSSIFARADISEIAYLPGDCTSFWVKTPARL